MTIEIFENIFAKCIIEFDKEQNKGLLHFIWFESSEQMQDEDYKQTMSLYLERYNEKVPENLEFLPALIDTRKFLFGIIPELQEWTNTEIYPYFKINSSKSKVAFLASEDFIAQLSLEQTTDEEYSQEAMNIRHFAHEKEALKWLKEN